MGMKARRGGLEEATAGTRERRVLLRPDHFMGSR